MLIRVYDIGYVEFVFKMFFQKFNSKFNLTYRYLYRVMNYFEFFNTIDLYCFLKTQCELT